MSETGRTEASPRSRSRLHSRSNGPAGVGEGSDGRGGPESASDRVGRLSVKRYAAVVLSALCAGIRRGVPSCPGIPSRCYHVPIFRVPVFRLRPLGGHPERTACVRIFLRRISAPCAHLAEEAFPAGSRRRPIGEEFRAETQRVQRRREDDLNVSRRVAERTNRRRVSRRDAEAAEAQRRRSRVSRRAAEATERDPVRWGSSTGSLATHSTRRIEPISRDGPILRIPVPSASPRKIPAPHPPVLFASLPPLRLCVKSRIRPMGFSLRLCHLCVSAWNPESARWDFLCASAASASLREIGFPPRLRVKSDGEVGSCGRAALGVTRIPPQ